MYFYDWLIYLKGGMTEKDEDTEKEIFHLLIHFPICYNSPRSGPGRSEEPQTLPRPLTWLTGSQALTLMPCQGHEEGADLEAKQLRLAMTLRYGMLVV